MLDGREIKKGDRLWCDRYGWGVVTGVDNRIALGVRMHFDSVGKETFTSDGKYLIYDLYPSLRWNEPERRIPPKKVKYYQWVCRRMGCYAIDERLYQGGDKPPYGIKRIEPGIELDDQ